RVEAGVELDGVEALRIEVEPILRRQPLRVPVLDEAGIRPARRTDDDRHALHLAVSADRARENATLGNRSYVNSCLTPHRHGLAASSAGHDARAASPPDRGPAAEVT